MAAAEHLATNGSAVDADRDVGWSPHRQDTETTRRTGEYARQRGPYCQPQVGVRIWPRPNNLISRRSWLAPDPLTEWPCAKAMWCPKPWSKDMLTKFTPPLSAVRITIRVRASLGSAGCMSAEGLNEGYQSIGVDSRLRHWLSYTVSRWSQSRIRPVGESVSRAHRFCSPPPPCGLCGGSRPWRRPGIQRRVGTRR